MNKLYKVSLISAALALASSGANAAVEIYKDDDTTFSVDGLVNVFYVSSSVETTDATGAKTDREQSRVRMGFLPNNVGLNFSKKTSDLTIGMRSSFWVSINDSDNNRDASPADLGTGSLVDVRQFYGTISGDFGEVLVGKDFGLFNRSNILGDELLLGYGQTSDFFGLVDGGNVSFGNISTGYTYPFPKSQITYRSPDMSGFQIAVGIMDPNKTSATSSEDTPRLETELVFSKSLENSSFKTWVSGVSQSSKTSGVSQDQSGFGYGANFKIAGVSLTASGFTSEGLGHVAGLDHIVGDDSIETEGFLFQASYTNGDNRFVLTHGETEVENTGSVLDATHTNTGAAYFKTITPGLTIVFEYNMTEADVTNSLVGEDNNTFAVGTVITF